MAKEKRVEQITDMEVDFAQWFTDVCTKAELVRQLDRGTITQEDVPEVWREEIIRRARELALDREAALGQDIDAQEALNIILGGEQA